MTAGLFSVAPFGTRAAGLAVWLATGVGVGLVAPAPGTIGGLWGLALVPPHRLWPTALEVQAIARRRAAACCGRASATSPPAPWAAPATPAPSCSTRSSPCRSCSSACRRSTLAALLARLSAVSPVRHLEAGPGRARPRSLPGGWGIVADDIVAAALAWVVLRGILWLDGATQLHWLAA